METSTLRRITAQSAANGIDKWNFLPLSMRNGRIFRLRWQADKGIGRETRCAPSRARACFWLSSHATRRRTIPSPGIARWAKGYGYKAIQIRPGTRRFFDLDKAYESETYCDEIKGKLADIGIAISELSTHFQGQMVSVHPAYDVMFDGQCPAHVRGNPEKRRHWAADQVRKAARVSRRLGLTEHVTFTGSLAWPYFYPYPQRPAGLIEECFAEQARRWKPILDVYRRERRRSLLRDPSDRGRFRRRHVRDVPRRGRRPQALQHQL